MAYNFQKSEIKNAIDGSGGYISEIARRLGCDWHTADKYIKQFELMAELQIEDEKSTDRAEIKLMEAVEKGEIAAIIFRLKTKAKKRGYVERQEITGADNQPIITISSNL
jgi:DNA-binding MarR family transcriptional regulator